MHYDVVSNGVLWFLFHDLFDRIRRPAFDHRFREAWDAYRDGQRGVRRRDRRSRGRAATSCSSTTTSSRSTGARLRELRPDLRIVHFTHTPFCGPDDLRVLPTYAAEDLCAALATHPGRLPHRSAGRASYHQSARDVLGRRRDDRADVRREPRPRRRRARRGRRRATKRAPRPNALDDAVGDRLVIARSDRIEPSKNIVRGFLAYDRLLEARPGLRGRVVFVAMLYPSRQTLPEYLAYANEIEQVVARVNDRWATRDWTPIVLDERDDFPRSIAAMQRYDVLLVNPIKDGLNLVAKEGPAVNRRDGLLCLSREAGAYEELRGAAIPVHPVRPRGRGGRARPRARDAARRTRRRSRSGCATLATARTPSDWVADLVAHASVTRRRYAPARFATATSSSASPVGPSTRTVDRGRAAPRASRATARRSGPRASSRPSAAARASASNAGRSPVSSPANAPTAKPVDQRVDRRALVDRDRRPQLDREARAPLREAVPAREVGRDARAPRRRGRDAVRQCNVTLDARLALDDHAREPRVGLVGRAPRPRRANGTTRGSTCRSPSTIELHPVRARRAPARAPGAGARGTPPAGRSRSRPARPGRPAARARRSRPAAPRRRRDDRRSARGSRRSRRGSRSPTAARRARRSLRRRRAQ